MKKIFIIAILLFSISIINSYASESVSTNVQTGDLGKLRFAIAKNNSNVGCHSTNKHYKHKRVHKKHRFLFF